MKTETKRNIQREDAKTPRKAKMEKKFWLKHPKDFLGVLASSRCPWFFIGRKNHV
jgi:hypothetical protein